MQDVLADAVLRLIGVFYAVACPLTVNAASMTSFLDKALAAISKVDPRVRSAETWRMRYLIGNAFLFGAGGILLAARLDIAAGVFAVSALSYTLYLFVLSPKLWDPYDPPEEPGRSQTWNAYWIYLGATAIVVGAWWSGLLLPWREQGWPALAICCGVFLAFVAFALHRLRPWQKFGTLSDLDRSYEAEDDGPARVVLTPSWYGSGLHDAATGEEIYWLPEKYLPFEESEKIGDWIETFHALADPHDPWRCGLKEPGALAKLEAEGRPIYERLVERMGAERVAFDPAPRPRSTQVDTPGVKLMADFDCDPLWFADSDKVGCFPAVHFGVSISLGNLLGEWQHRFDSSYDRADPRRQNWTKAEAKEHAVVGRALAARLADELARTGRAHVAIYYQPTGGKRETIRPAGR